MEQQVVIYQLSRKVVNERQDVPEEARQVMYYSLAIGHHVGVMDCFSVLTSLPAESYRRCLEGMPEGEARRKLEGVLKWQEIEINRGHADELLPALQGLLPLAEAEDTRWVQAMIRSLQDMLAEPALYLMVKMRS